MLALRVSNCAFDLKRNPIGRCAGSAGRFDAVVLALSFLE